MQRKVTKKMTNIILDKNKTFLKYNIKNNTIIHVQVDLTSVFSPPKIDAKVDQLVSNTNHNINTSTFNTNQEIIWDFYPAEKKMENRGQT